jgi:hypothetical protein
MKRFAMTAALLLGAVVSAQASPSRDRLCTADVLHSEELTFAPIYYHLVRTDLRIIPPNGPAYQTTVEKMLPWQTPPPRQGQRYRFWCDAAQFSEVR